MLLCAEEANNYSCLVLLLLWGGFCYCNVAVCCDCCLSAEILENGCMQNAFFRFLASAVPHPRPRPVGRVLPHPHTLQHASR